MQAHHLLSGVLYAEDFDTEVEVAVKPPAPVQQPDPVVVEPTFSLIDLQNASRHARLEERAQLMHEAQQDAMSIRNRALATLTEAVAAAHDEAVRLSSEAADAVSSAFLASLSALLPGLANRFALRESVRLLRIVLPTLADKPRLAIRANPVLLETLQSELVPATASATLAIDWIVGEGMGNGDLSVKWEQGALVRDMSGLCEKICTLLSAELNDAPTSNGADREH